MKKCPKCGRGVKRLLAVSRMDNKTMVCDECGIREALEDSVSCGALTPQEYAEIVAVAMGEKYSNCDVARKGLIQGGE